MTLALPASYCEPTFMCLGKFCLCECVCVCVTKQNVCLHAHLLVKCLCKKDSCCLFIHFICWQKMFGRFELCYSPYFYWCDCPSGVSGDLWKHHGSSKSLEIVMPTIWLQLQHAEHYMSVDCTALRSNLEESLSDLGNHVVLILNTWLRVQPATLATYKSLRAGIRQALKLKVRSWVRWSTRIRNPKAVAIASECNKDAIPMVQEFLNCIDPIGQVSGIVTKLH